MKQIKFGLLLLLLPLTSCTYTNKSIVLDEKNNIAIRGAITDELADEVIKSLITKEPQYIYIYSNGGSVMAGNRIIMHLIDRNVTCIAERAYSMAFVILQACKYRYIVPTATVMQHQMSTGLRGNLYSITGYMEMLHSVEHFLTKMQADKIGISEKEFLQKSNLDWWLFGETIISNNVADEIVDVHCTTGLIDKQVSILRNGFFEDVLETYSACPLLLKPIETQTQNSIFQSKYQNDDNIDQWIHMKQT
jgi:ATP-dependent protease ClpP protease subunit